MKKFFTFAGAAAIMLGCFAGFAHAGTPQTHTMSIRFPDGQVGQITYTGDTPPAVAVAPQGVPGASPWAPVALTAFSGPVMASPFAEIDRIQALMDRQMAAMFRNVDAMMAHPGLPQGVVQAATGPGVCMRSIQITYTGHGQPHVVSQTSGNCAPAGGNAVPTALPAAPLPKRAPHLIEANTLATAPHGHTRL